MEDYVTKKEFDTFLKNHFHTLDKKVDGLILSFKINMRWLTTIALGVFGTLIATLITKVL